MRQAPLREILANPDSETMAPWVGRAVGNRRFDVGDIDWSLYAIVDRAYVGARSFGEVAEAAIRGGAGVVQIRDKTSSGREFYYAALQVRKVTGAHGVPFIVNDRVDIALAVDADGVHVGWSDLPPDAARALIGGERLLGLSASSEEEIERALEYDIDYLGVGAVFPTRTEPGYRVPGPGLIVAARKMTQLPIVGIGGITPENCREVIGAGADGVAVISSLLQAEDVRAQAEAFLAAIRQARSS